MIGQSIAHYTITAKIGQGGMGEVYRATDTKLKRDVALKILPEEFTNNAERLRRFRREAKMLASLNHANIGAIYGLEESAPLHVLVLELVEGETLTERIRRGPLRIDDALKIALQIAEALESAHEKGIIHRDLKPDNVKITPEGQVKVLDFGLAKALESESSSAPGLTHSSAQATATGIILGTPAYMSPEQAKGKPVDKRTDIWAFGCVVYEMLTGRRLFQEEDIAAVLRSKMEWGKGKGAASPIAILRLLRRCLERDQRNRLRDIGDARISIQDCLADPMVDEPDLLVANARWRQSIPWVIAIGLAVIVVVMSQRESLVIRNEPPLSRTQIILPSTSQLGFGATFAFDPNLVALSPDGKNLVFVGRTAEGTQLFLRPMDSLDISPIVGTQGAIHAFFSPDSNWVGFLMQDRVKKISLRGGGPITLCEAPTPIRAIWTRDETIYFSSHQGTVLNSVPAAGGDPKRIANRNLVSGRISDILPDGRSALVSSFSLNSVSRDYSGIDLLSLQSLRRSISLMAVTTPATFRPVT